MPTNSIMVERRATVREGKIDADNFDPLAPSKIDQATGASAIFSERLKALGLHNETFKSELRGEDKVRMFSVDDMRNRKVISIVCKKLFKNAQKFSFSQDGRYIGVANKNGTKITILELIEDRKRGLHESILIAICYRGFWGCHIKTITFSPDNNFILVTSDNGT